MPLLVPSVSSQPHKDMGSQTMDVISFSAALRQLQAATWSKAWLEQELFLEWEGLSRTHEDQRTRITKVQEDQWARMTKEQEDLWARIIKQVDTTFSEVLSQISQAKLVRLLPWFLSATANPGAAPIHSVREALTTVMHSRVDAPVDDTVPKFESSQAPPSMSIPVH